MEFWGSEGHSAQFDLVLTLFGPILSYFAIFRLADLSVPACSRSSLAPNCPRRHYHLLRVLSRRVFGISSLGRHTGKATTQIFEKMLAQWGSSFFCHICLCRSTSAAFCQSCQEACKNQNGDGGKVMEENVTTMHVTLQHLPIFATSLCHFIISSVGFVP